ncbi:MAG TPA: FecR domain-containing protein, partial [Polyangiaceae bacterium]|nr:FecR domain-containing protein [Polyangiaceae bacterium]
THHHAARPRRRATLALAAAAVLVGGLGTWRLWPRPLSYEVRGGSGFDGPYVSASPLSPAELIFSDGSNLQADPGCRLRVDETYRNGARVFVERGSTTTRVTHEKASNWTFVAGPFEVHVTGTRFALSWDPLVEEIDLRLIEGSVEVRSPLAQGPIVVRAGQRFRAAVSSRSLMVTEGDGVPVTTAVPALESASTPVAAVTPPPEPAPAPAPAVAPPPNPKGPAHRDSWQELLTRGDFESIVVAANAKGLDSCVSNCAAGDLRSLADAARYTGRGDLAEKCLLALRQRFPTGAHAAAAAFMLGRTHETRNRPTTAQRWYETYLAESPDGEFAAEALAGKMRAVTTTRGPASAKPLALEYLRRYPQGVHVRTARKIAGVE